MCYKSQIRENTSMVFVGIVVCCCLLMGVGGIFHCVSMVSCNFYNYDSHLVFTEVGALVASKNKNNTYVETVVRTVSYP